MPLSDHSTNDVIMTLKSLHNELLISILPRPREFAVVRTVPYVYSKGVVLHSDILTTIYFLFSPL
jgi:hypothetical protein